MPAPYTSLDLNGVMGPRRAFTPKAEQVIVSILAGHVTWDGDDVGRAVAAGDDAGRVAWDSDAVGRLEAPESQTGRVTPQSDSQGRIEDA